MSVSPMRARTREESYRSALVALRVVIRIAVASVYSGALVLIYSSWVAPHGANLGFTYAEPDSTTFTYVLLLAAIPAAILPRALTAASDFFVWMIYFFIYIPCSIVPAMLGYLAPGDIIHLTVALFLAFLAIARFPRFKLPAPPVRPLSKQFFWFVFIAVYVALTGLVLFAFRGQMSFAGLDEIYDKRASGIDILSQSAIGIVAGYANGFLFGAFNPFLLALGVMKRRPIVFMVGALGNVLLYTTIASKATLLCVVITPLFYLLTIEGKRGQNLIRIGYIVLAVAIIPFALYQTPLFNDDSGFFSQVIMQVIYQRTLMTPGAVLGQYADFFTTHPHTYFTHVGLLSKIIPYHYPYNERLGYVIADYVFKHQTGGDIEYNANLFATDGVAALGNVGVVIIGIVLGFMLRVIDTFIRPALVPLFCAAGVTSIMVLANGSLFGTLLSGGLGALILICVGWGQTEREARVSPVASGRFPRAGARVSPQLSR